MRSEERKRVQHALLEGGENIVYGSLEGTGLTLAQLQAVDRHSKLVVETFGGGLTAEVFKIKSGDRLFNLKKRRERILVSNEDGQLSFLNEVLSRIHFEKHRKLDTDWGKVLDRAIVRTVYADHAAGILLSEWLEGETITAFEASDVGQIYACQLAMEQSGKFEWDMSQGNMVMTEEGVRFFDFGYLYDMRFETDVNSEGFDNPVFHLVERLETRSLMPYLLKVENEQGLAQALALFKGYKQQAIQVYRKKMTLLSQDSPVWQFCKAWVERWEAGLQDAPSLARLYAHEGFRSYALDVHDDLSGKSCTLRTLEKLDRILSVVEAEYEMLIKEDLLLWFDQGLDQQALLDTYQARRELAVSYRVDVA